MPRALLSVADKTGIADLARGLVERGFTIISTGGTREAIAAAGVPVVPVEEVTGFPEILGGRVKTLHPNVHGAILARPGAGHHAELSAHGIEPIDVVVVNLYPFRETAARPGVSLPEVVEQIDIGGPAMLRAAAKNFERVWAVVDPADYGLLLDSLQAADASLRRHLARKAFEHTASYDRAVADYLGVDAEAQAEALPERIELRLERVQELRYGENPHQRGARYRLAGESGFWDEAVQHKGSALSYLNTFDAEAAWRLAFEFDAPACAIIKHANPCGFAVAEGLHQAYERAFAADPKSAFGGVVALNRPVDGNLASAIMANPKADVLIATAYSDEALAILAGGRKAMRVITAPPPERRGLEFRGIAGGFLVQEADEVNLDRSAWRVVTEREPTEEQWRDLEVAWVVCARTSSNAIVLVRGGVAVGIGAGQQSRVDAAAIAARKAAGRAAGGACASDAFYPFRDGLDAAADAGVAAVIQPGGSVRDNELIDAANERGLAMVFTGQRHFRH